MERILKAVESVVLRTGAFILESSGKFQRQQIEEKSENNFVTWVDRAAEEMLAEGLNAILPDAGFILEENSRAPEIREFTWVVDPLDGTTNFIHGIPLVCISVSLLRGNEPEIGVVYEVFGREMFTAQRGQGAHLNGKKIRVSSNASLQHALLATGFPYYDYERLDEYLALFRHLMQASHGIRRLGSAAADLAWVACGRFDGFYEYGLSPWDVAAGALLVKEAGGCVADFGGGRHYLFGKEIVAGNDAIFPELLSTMKNFFKSKP
ncbi:MAG TPA: inositol monophosphatase family protein [Bacteroidales bacterium]|nr:inositol monophosphatase family protein [Bacteroidales bacterium]HSA43779.1 inositol monophosphatase family protein [Bacteroidales bacterium]